jgi:predicted O-methyltransferase YrrM
MPYVLNEKIKSFILENYDKYRDELKSDFFEVLRADRESERFGFDGQMSDVNGNLLWIITRELKPKTVLEFSCSRGYTTLIMLEAIKKNGVGHLYGLEPGYDTKSKEEKLSNLRKNLEYHKRFCTIWENEITILPEIFKVQNAFDFIFIDTLHDAKTVNYYTNEINIWDHLNPNGWMQIHDIWKDGGRESIHVLNWLQTLKNCDFWFPIHQYNNPLRLNSFGVRSKTDFRYPVEKAVWVKKIGDKKNEKMIYLDGIKVTQTEIEMAKNLEEFFLQRIPKIDPPKRPKITLVKENGKISKKTFDQKLDEFKKISKKKTKF